MSILALFVWLHDIDHDGIRHNDTQYNVTRHYYAMKCDTQHFILINVTIKSLMLCSYAERRIMTILLNVVLLNVVAPLMLLCARDH